MPRTSKGILLWISAGYVFTIFFHFTDLNPIWFWDWYRETIGEWISSHPRFVLTNFFLAIFLLPWILSEVEHSCHCDAHPVAR